MTTPTLEPIPSPVVLPKQNDEEGGPTRDLRIRDRRCLSVSESLTYDGLLK